MIALQHPVSTREEVRSTLEGVLARDEFGGKPSWIVEQSRKLFDALSDLLDGLFPDLDPAVNHLILKGMLWVLVAVLALAIGLRLARLVRGWVDAPPRPAAEGIEARRAASVAALRREARAAAARGDRLAALRLLFRALVLGLSERGDLEYRDAWTNRELLERGSPRRDVAPILAGLVPRLDAQSFGHEPAGPADVENLSSLCDRLLGRIPA